MKAKCVVCLREYDKFDKVRNGSRGRIARKSNCKTCSGKCSKIYARIRKCVNSYWVGRLERNGIKLSDFKK